MLAFGVQSSPASVLFGRSCTPSLLASILASRRSLSTHQIDPDAGAASSAPLWLVAPVEEAWWQARHNQVEYISWLRHKLSLDRSMDDLYSLTAADFEMNGGTALLRLHHRRPHRIVTQLFPDHDWLPWRFESGFVSWWKRAEHRMSFVNWLRRRLHLDRALDDLYRLHPAQVVENHGVALLWHHGSVAAAVRELIPNHSWQIHSFPQESLDVWFVQKHHQTSYMSWLRKHLGLGVSLDQLYDLKNKDVLDNLGAHLIMLYDGSPQKLLQNVYPEHEWLPWMFTTAPKGWWRTREHQLLFMAWLRRKLGCDGALDELYKLNQQDFIKNSGGRLLALHGSSPPAVVASLFPDHEWLPWRFSTTPRSWWQKLDNQLRYLLWLLTHLGLSTSSQLQFISRRNLLENDGISLLKVYEGSMHNMVQRLGPLLDLRVVPTLDSGMSHLSTELDVLATTQNRRIFRMNRA